MYVKNDYEYMTIIELFTITPHWDDMDIYNYFRYITIEYFWRHILN